MPIAKTKRGQTGTKKSVTAQDRSRHETAVSILNIKDQEGEELCAHLNFPTYDNDGNERPMKKIVWTEVKEWAKDFTKRFKRKYGK